MGKRKKITNWILSIGFTACMAWAAVADGMIAMIPTILCIYSGIRIVEINTDYVRRY